MKDSLKNIFDDSFLKTKNEIVKIIETTNKERCNISLKNGIFYEFRIKDLKDATAPFIAEKKSSIKFGMRDICDGVILETSKKTYTIYFIELKNNIKDIKKAINQLQATRIRLLSLLSVTNIDLLKIKSVFIIGGDTKYLTDLSSLKQEKGQRLFYDDIALVSYKFRNKKKANISAVPTQLKNIINKDYQTEKINVFQFDCDKVIDINNIN